MIYVQRNLVTALLSIFIVFGAVSPVLAESESSKWGAAAAQVDQNLSVRDMLTYALQDEYLAQAEYKLIIKNYGDIRPFTNIVRSENTHITLLKPLFSKYKVPLPNNYSAGRISLPASINAAMTMGVNAEVANIAMYNRFLEQDLPPDVKTVFIQLRNASQNHLKAFSRKR